MRQEEDVEENEALVDVNDVLPKCPTCGEDMYCLKNEVDVHADGWVRSGDLYCCDHDSRNQSPEYVVRGLGSPLD